MTDTRVTQAIAEVAEVATPATNVSQVVLEVANAEPWPGPPAGGGQNRKGVRGSTSEAIAWSIGGTPVLLEWDSARMTAPGGYENMQGRVTGSLQTRRLHQGASVVGVRPNGQVLYKGTLVSPPKMVNGVAIIEAEGYQAIIRRRNQRLPYVISDGSQWSQSNETPFDYPNNEKFNLQARNNGIGWIIGNSVSYANTDRAGYALYVPGHPVQRIRATIRKSGDNSNFDLEVRDADDIGAASVVTTKTLGAGTADGDTWNVNAVNQNTVLINVISNAATSPGAVLRVTLQHLRACVLADDDDWTCSDVVSDVAERVGFADNVSASGTDIGALDWTGSWDELLTYMAAIEDWTWLVEEDRTKNSPTRDAMLTFRDWGNHVWRTNLDLAQESLTVAPLYNKVTVHFERPEGVPQHKSYEAADFADMDDPIPGLTYEYPDAPVLENPQRTTELADAIGERLLRRAVETRLVGNIKVLGLLNGMPFDIKAGDMLDIGGYTPEVGPQRIASVTYNADGTVDCSLERSYNIAAMLYRLTAHRRRSTPHKWGAGHRS